ncbi:hypothetical protein SEPCBS119000_006460 [Sporothrix epigloea]|uniref:ethanolamine kinase n=1 Tax=Sporothrix epigloea TaxID=1892477 RepID=A0ABP0E346_9PEZI
MAFEASREQVRLLPLRYDPDDSDGSARRLVLELLPHWQSKDSNVELVRFTDGITNTLLKAVNKRAGLSPDETDRDAILLRAYGPGTDLIIDRQREAQNHELLMRHGLAPTLLARFENGMLYRFISGRVTRPEDLRRPEVSAAIARKLAQWHATVPCICTVTPTAGALHHDDSDRKVDVTQEVNGNTRQSGSTLTVVHEKPEPNIWSVMQKWILALPSDTSTQQNQAAILQDELNSLVAQLSQRPGLGKNGLVFSHNDLLCGNIIMLPTATGQSDRPPLDVTFIDYEYAVPSPAAFDIANHFAEWGGFDCDMTVLPTVAQRRAFIGEYIRVYTDLHSSTFHDPIALDTSVEEAKLLQEVDLFRGVPGFYWGIWSLIQATISDIDFDYASYSKIRLAEYWAWKAEISGERAKANADVPLRERRWAQETDTSEGV